MIKKINQLLMATMLSVTTATAVAAPKQVNGDNTAAVWTSESSTPTINAGDYVVLDGVTVTFGSQNDGNTTWTWNSGNKGVIPSQMPSTDGTANTLVTTFSEKSPYGTLPTNGNFFTINPTENGKITFNCKPSTDATQKLVFVTSSTDDPNTILSASVISSIWDSSYSFDVDSKHVYRFFQLSAAGKLTSYRFTLRGLSFEKNSLQGNNIAPFCSEVEASYTANWNYLYAIYDGKKGYGELANGYTWGSWSENRPAEQWLRYGWNDKVTVDQTNVYFWTNTQTPGKDVYVPESWKIQYWNAETQAWQDVELEDGQSYTVKAAAPNVVKFKPVETTQLRMAMKAAGDGTTYSALGVTEWEVMGTIDAKEVVYGDYPIENVDFSKVHLNDKFWTARMEQNQSVTIPIALEQCYKTNRVLNFQKAAAILRGENIGYFDTENTFDDTDIYKILEGMAYSVQSKPNAELDKKMDELIEIIGAAQEPDGYLYTPRTAGKPGALHSWVGAKRWEKDPDLSHELYNCGHLYEAATAHYISTGKRSLLDIAIKNADLLVKDFLEGGLTYEPGHQIVEMGLVKMYRVTGNEKYLKLAKYFLDLRGLKGVMRKEYSQTNKPVIMQDEAVGHAVRAAYMYSGMADVAAIMGDKSYLNAIDKIWDNVVEKKYYITGGIGAKINGEAFDVNYKLPNREAYCETCAAIANVYWNWRMFLLHGEAKYYDVIERTLYNGLISGISLSGDHFFYPNPLESNGKSAVAGRDVVRSEWFGCACCPSNLCRFTASVPGYIYAHHGDSLYVNLYIQGTGNIDMNNGEVVLTQTTEMPWKGGVSIRVDKNTESEFCMMLRLPGWANGKPVPSDLYTYVDGKPANIVVKVNDETVDYDMSKGYMVVKRLWKEGDVVSFELPMEVHKTIAHENVADDKGKMELERGPIVYCIESPDNSNIASSYITEQAVATPVWTDDMNGLMKLNVENQNSFNGIDHLVAIPYYAWANRGKSLMKVWISSSAPKPYAFNAKDWTSGDTNRLKVSDITYDEDNNVLKPKSKGTCNIDLMMDYKSVNYNVKKVQKYLLVRGSNLSTDDGSACLWWLNGINNGTSVKANVMKTIELDGKEQTVIAWDLSASGLYDTFNVDYPNICQGQTIFGVTSTADDGSCEIYDIDFVEDVDAYINTTGISNITNSKSKGNIYDLAGRKVKNLNAKGIYIVDGKKQVVK